MSHYHPWLTEPDLLMLNLSPANSSPLTRQRQEQLGMPEQMLDRALR